MQKILTISFCIYAWYYAWSYSAWHFIDNVNLIFHEAGHALFMFFGEYIHVAMGSGFQIILPLGIALYFFYHGQRISGSLCLLWVGQNLLNVSIYAADAQMMNLQLLGGDGVIHDWNYLLETTGILRYTHSIALILYTMGILMLSMGTVLSIYYSLNSHIEEKSSL